MAKQSDKVSKLRKIINGTLSALSLLPPQSYMVTVEETISGTTYSVEGEQYNEEAFNLWREANLREEDRIFFIQDADGCDPILENPAELYNLLRVEAPKEPILDNKKRRKGKVSPRPERAEFKPMEAEIKDIQPAEPIQFN